MNAVAISFRWDPYPFILLNLLFSTQAAYAAPLILLAQTRQAADHSHLHRTERHPGAGSDLALAEFIVETHAKQFGLLAWNQRKQVCHAPLLGDLVGQVFALLVLTVAAAETAIGLAILVVFYRNRGSIAVEDINLMKG